MNVFNLVQSMKNNQVWKDAAKKVLELTEIQCVITWKFVMSYNNRILSKPIISNQFSTSTNSFLNFDY